VEWLNFTSLLPVEFLNPLPTIKLSKMLCHNAHYFYAMIVITFFVVNITKLVVNVVKFAAKGSGHHYIKIVSIVAAIIALHCKM